MSLLDDNTYTYLAHQQMLRDTWGMDDAALGRYSRGLLAGAMGLPSDNLDETGRKGWALGNAGREKSMDLREKKAAGGRKSAENRREAKGTAQPSRQESSEDSSEVRSNSLPNSVRGNVGESSNLGRKEGRKEEEQVLQTNLSVNSARDLSVSPGSGSADAGNNPRRILADAETMTPEQIRAIPMPRPTRAQFLAYARLHWPEWHQPKVGSIYADLSAKAWVLDGKPVHDWTKLLRKLRSMADPAHIGKRFPIGSALRTVAPDLSSMRFQA